MQEIIKTRIIFTENTQIKLKIQYEYLILKISNAENTMLKIKIQPTLLDTKRRKDTRK